VAGIAADLEPAADGYSYSAASRRDPFISLMKPVAADQTARQRPQGIEGFRIADIALKGIVKTAGGGTGVGQKSGLVAILVGTDNKSYFIREGQRVYDGMITAIDSTSVTFRQEVTDPLSPVRTKDVKKSLYASEEARR
jgi:Tfp pilus assembly protein PilP